MPPNHFSFCSNEHEQSGGISRCGPADRSGSAHRLLRSLICKRREISALSMLSQCQKYALNWWGVTFTKSHTIALTRASLIPRFLPVCAPRQTLRRPQAALAFRKGCLTLSNSAAHYRVRSRSTIWLCQILRWRTVYWSGALSDRNLKYFLWPLFC